MLRRGSESTDGEAARSLLAVACLCLSCSQAAAAATAASPRLADVWVDGSTASAVLAGPVGGPSSGSSEDSGRIHSEASRPEQPLCRNFRGGLVDEAGGKGEVGEAGGVVDTPEYMRE
mmetsp:Transcript_153865/g.491829  ORF Transcript_153865/g.491829 Transcript_153865/m.491829 type:complete len:118 (-) Transcript_153865:221-574(-)